jgi:GAF domain-containing protein
MLETQEPYRTDDIHDHPRFRGWWPRGHPDMRSFLGVPIVTPRGVVGAFYLTEKIGAADFTDEDEKLIELLAAHAAIAIANARLYERSRELSVVKHRTDQATRPAAATLVVRATRGRCWLSVRRRSEQGRHLFEGTLARGESRRFADGPLWIRIGAPWNLEASLNGRRLSLPPTVANLLMRASGIRALTTE